MDTSSGSVARHPSQVIVKLAFSREHTDRLRHEYSIYRRLSHRPVRVENIPTAFGFFEDVESDAGALVLSHNGEAVAYRSDSPGSGIPVSPKERWCPRRDSQVWRWLTHAFQSHNTPNPRKYTRGWYCSCQSVCIIKGFTSTLKRVWHRSQLGRTPSRMWNGTKIDCREFATNPSFMWEL